MTAPAPHRYDAATPSTPGRLVVVLVTLQWRARGNASHEPEDECLRQSVQHVRHSGREKKLSPIEKYTEDAAERGRETNDATPRSEPDLWHGRVGHVADHQNGEPAHD